MSTHSCLGEPWKITNFTKLYQDGLIERRTDDILYLEDGVIEVSMALQVSRCIRVYTSARGHPQPASSRVTLTLQIKVKMHFRGPPVSKDILKIDFFIACGQLRENMDSTVLNKQKVVAGNCLKNYYNCRKENLGTDPSLTPNDTLTLIPRFSIWSNIVEVPIKKTKFVETNPIEKLFANDEFADFVFSVRGVDFKVHKAIIAARSTVFEAMMRHDMKEKSDNRAEVTDVDPAAFKEMLRYVYTGKVENLSNVVQELIKIAEKYDLPGLKNICEDELSKGLCPNNAVELLKQADMFGCERLKAQTIEYICRNSAHVMDTDAWKHLASSQTSKLIGEICSGMSQQKALHYVRLPPVRCSRKSMLNPDENLNLSESSSDDD